MGKVQLLIHPEDFGFASSGGSGVTRVQG